MIGMDAFVDTKLISNSTNKNDDLIYQQKLCEKSVGTTELHYIAQKSGNILLAY